MKHLTWIIAASMLAGCDFKEGTPAPSNQPATVPEAGKYIEYLKTQPATRFEVGMLRLNNHAASLINSVEDLRQVEAIYEPSENRIYIIGFHESWFLKDMTRAYFSSVEEANAACEEIIWSLRLHLGFSFGNWMALEEGKITEPESPTNLYAWHFANPARMFEGYGEDSDASENIQREFDQLVFIAAWLTWADYTDASNKEYGEVICTDTLYSGEMEFRSPGKGNI